MYEFLKMWAVTEDWFINIFVHIPSPFAQPCLIIHLRAFNSPPATKLRSVLNLRRTDQGQGLKAVIADIEIRR